MKNIINKLKFARAGQGHKLNEERPQLSNQSKPEPTSYRNEKPLHSQVQAGSAALARFEKDQAKSKKISGKAFRSTSRTDENEDSNQQSSSSGSSIAESNDVYFESPFIHGKKIRRENFESHIKKYLIKLFETDQSAAACSMIKSLNKDDVIEAGIRIIFKYIDNIIANPNEEKYRKIRKNNRIYQERVETLFGSEYFLIAAGFTTQLVQVEEDGEEYFVLDDVDVERLQNLKSKLEREERIQMKLSRHPQIFTTKLHLDKDSVEDDFFKLSAKELKQIQTERSQQLELSKQLRTQKMRDASLKPTTNHKFTMIKIRFPSGKVLQGTFYSTETIEDLKMFVWEHITNKAGVFQLLLQNKQLTEDQMTLHGAGMVPAVLIHLRWDEEILQKLKQAGIDLDLKS